MLRDSVNISDNTFQRPWYWNYDPEAEVEQSLVAQNVANFSCISTASRIHKLLLHLSAENWYPYHLIILSRYSYCQDLYRNGLGLISKAARKPDQ